MNRCRWMLVGLAMAVGCGDFAGDNSEVDESDPELGEPGTEPGPDKESVAPLNIITSRGSACGSLGDMNLGQFGGGYHLEVPTGERVLRLTDCDGTVLFDERVRIGGDQYNEVGIFRVANLSFVEYHAQLLGDVPGDSYRAYFANLLEPAESGTLLRCDRPKPDTIDCAELEVVGPGETWTGFVDSHEFLGFRPDGWTSPDDGILAEPSARSEFRALSFYPLEYDSTGGSGYWLVLDTDFAEAFR